MTKVCQANLTKVRQADLTTVREVNSTGALQDLTLLEFVKLSNCQTPKSSLTSYNYPANSIKIHRKIPQ
jgi:hypothetical protein